MQALAPHQEVVLLGKGWARDLPVVPPYLTLRGDNVFSVEIQRAIQLDLLWKVITPSRDLSDGLRVRHIADNLAGRDDENHIATQIVEWLPSKMSDPVMIAQAA